MREPKVGFKKSHPAYLEWCAGYKREDVEDYLWSAPLEPEPVRRSQFTDSDLWICVEKVVCRQMGLRTTIQYGHEIKAMSKLLSDMEW